MSKSIDDQTLVAHKIDMDSLSFQAHYHSAESSRLHRVDVLLEGGRLRIRGASVAAAHDLARVRLAPRVLGNTLRALQLPDGSQLETLDRAALDRLEQELGTAPLGRILERWQASWWAAVVATLLVLGSLVSAYTWGIPLLSRRIARVAPELAQRIGAGSFELLGKVLKPSQLPLAEQRRHRDAFATLAADYPHLRLELRFLHAGFANAFSLPDGTVVLSDELVQLSTHDDQLYAVMLHEIGHVAQGHSLRHVLESSALGVLVMTYWGDADQVTALAAGLPALYANSRYSQAEETEADLEALQGMRRHQRPLHHYADILRRLEQLQSKPDVESLQMRFLSSHPSARERAERFDAAERADSVAHGSEAVPAP